MPTKEEQWQKFERDAVTYLKWLVCQDEQELGRDDYTNLVYLKNTLDEYYGEGRWHLDGDKFEGHGGHDNRVSDIKVLTDVGGEFWIEAKMRSAQCGQMVVEQNELGNFVLASADKVSAPIDYEDDDMEEIEGEREEICDYEDFNISDADYLTWAREDFLDAMTRSYRSQDADSAEYASDMILDNNLSVLDDASGHWDSRRFLVDDPVSTYLVFTHYQHKNAQMFITKRHGVTYKDKDLYNGWLLFPADYLDEYFSIWATYRSKKSGSGSVSNVHLSEALSLFGLDSLPANRLQDIKGLGWCVSLPGDTDDSPVLQGTDFRFKLLDRGEDPFISTNHIFQIRQLSNTLRPSVVMQLKVKPNRLLTCHNLFEADELGWDWR